MAVHKISAKDSAGSSEPAAPKKTNKVSKPTKTTKAATPAEVVETIKPTKTPKTVKTVKAVAADAGTTSKNPFVALGGYFKGAWFELREVRWPTRRATWSLTLAVLVFTAFFMVLILLLDAGYKALFETILK